MGPQCKCAQCEGVRNSVAFIIAVPDFSQIDTGLLGLAVMLDKPIIVVCTPGLKVPDKLAKVVDRFVELSPGMQPAQIIEAVKTAIDMGILTGDGPVRPGYDTEPSQN
jgi:predicted RNase H-like nuclease